MSREEEHAREILRAHGEELRRTRHGRLFRVAGRIVMVGGEHGKQGPRHWKNVLADLRRALRSPAHP